MKQLTDTERLKVAMNILSAWQVDEYAERCRVLELDCEHNGFYNTPAECEGLECNRCQMTKVFRIEVDCPYVD